ncbi:hypothetical protein SprV_0301143600 [Sparganum proliferum]
MLTRMTMKSQWKWNTGFQEPVKRSNQLVLTPRQIKPSRVERQPLSSASGLFPTAVTAEAMAADMMESAGQAATVGEPSPKFPELVDGGYLAFRGPHPLRLSTVRSNISGTATGFHLRMSVKFVGIRSQMLMAYYASRFFPLIFLLRSEQNKIELRLFNVSGNDNFYLAHLLQHPQPIKEVGLTFHEIAFGLHLNGELYLSLNGQTVAEQTAFSSSWMFDETQKSLLQKSALQHELEHSVFIGGHPAIAKGQPHELQITGMTHHSFVGCLDEIYLNGRLLDPRREKFVGDVIDGYGVRDCAGDICTHQPCQDRGHCLPKGADSFESLIPKIPEFYGSSYLVFWGIKATSMTDTFFQVVFLPRNPTGLLAYSGYSFDRRGDFFMVALVDGKVLVSFDLGTGPAFLRSSTNLTLDQWHTVDVRRMGRSFAISVDNAPSEVEAFTEGSFIQLTISDHLFLGGHPNPDHLSALMPDADRLSSYKAVLGLTGCIQMVSVNGRILRLIKDAVNATNVGNCDNHSCAAQVPTCHQPAECLPQGSTSLCLCHLGYAGNACQKSINVKALSKLSFDGYSYLKFLDSHMPSLFMKDKFTLELTLEPRMFATRQTNDTKRVLLFLRARNAGVAVHVALSVIQDWSLELDVLQVFSSRLVQGPSLQTSLFPPRRQSMRKSTKLIAHNIRTVTLKRNGNLYELQVGTKQVSRLTLQPLSPDPYFFSELFIGGLDIQTTSKLHYMEQFLTEKNRFSSSRFGRVDFTELKNVRKDGIACLLASIGRQVTSVPLVDHIKCDLFPCCSDKSNKKHVLVYALL